PAVRAGGELRPTARRGPGRGTAVVPERKAERGDGGDREHRPAPPRQAAARRPSILAPMTEQGVLRTVTHRASSSPRSRISFLAQCARGSVPWVGGRALSGSGRRLEELGALALGRPAVGVDEQGLVAVVRRLQ